MVASLFLFIKRECRCFVLKMLFVNLAVNRKELTLEAFRQSLVKALFFFYTKKRNVSWEVFLDVCRD